MELLWCLVSSVTSRTNRLLAGTSFQSAQACGMMVSIAIYLLANQLLSSVTSFTRTTTTVTLII